MVSRDASDETDDEAFAQRREVESDVTYNRYLRHVENAAAQAAEGSFKLPSPETLWIAITENCNLRCVGCYAEGMFKKTYLTLDDLRSILSSAGQSFTYVSLTEGEAFLHPKIDEIVSLCKELQPLAKIWVISNGTIAIKDRLRRALPKIDKLALSIDGAKKETFEAIRHGANFERFQSNVNDIVEIRKATGHPDYLGFSFTATRTNLFELSGVVELASKMGVPNVWAQPMEAGPHPEISRRVEAISIDGLEPTDIARALHEAKAVAKQLGVNLDLAASLAAAGAKANSIASGAPDVAHRRNVEQELEVRMCQYMWKHDFRYLVRDDQIHVLPCCYMHNFSADELTEEYGLRFDKTASVEEIFNSSQFWELRRDLAKGKLARVCGKCHASRNFRWKE
jgi:MoaA/NifB/PqqE/SkfB family radical SAM enzyme